MVNNSTWFWLRRGNLKRQYGLILIAEHTNTHKHANTHTIHEKKMR